MGKQGVFLLNAILTVRANEPASHAKIGWMDFTDAVIKKISAEKKGVVFLLWGKFAQEKQVLIDETKHSVLKAAHPSPFSADKGFFGCKHFSRTNKILMDQGMDAIDWDGILERRNFDIEIAIAVVGRLTNNAGTKESCWSFDWNS
jgi:uracil-DNA glycosylase